MRPELRLYISLACLLSVSLNGPEPVEEPEAAVEADEELAFNDNFASEQLP